MQQLAMADDDADPRRKSSLSKFDKVCAASAMLSGIAAQLFEIRPCTESPSYASCHQSCVAAFLDVVIGGRAVETPPMSAMNLLEGLSRTAVYITHNQLLALVSSFTVDIKISKCDSCIQIPMKRENRAL